MQYKRRRSPAYNKTTLSPSMILKENKMEVMRTFSSGRSILREKIGPLKISQS
jgi:hypothetical protein